MKQGWNTLTSSFGSTTTRAQVWRAQVWCGPCLWECLHTPAERRQRARWQPPRSQCLRVTATTAAVFVRRKGGGSTKAKALPQLEETFFKASLNLNTQFPTPAILGASRQSGKAIALAELQKAFGGPKDSVALSCKGSQLSMVSMCFTKDLARVACPASTLASSYDNGCTVRGIKHVSVAFNCTL